MLELLHLHNVGPAPEMRMEFAPRLNLITGDNGLGKSFLLDVAWWALTGKWPQELNANLSSGYPARPVNVKLPATITMKLRGQTHNAPYSQDSQTWRVANPPARNQSLVLSVFGDGGFAVWDPHRNGWHNRPDGGSARFPAYVFSNAEVWDGLDVKIDGKSTRACNGLLVDWASWIREQGQDARRMAEVLRLLGPSSGDLTLEPGPSFARLSVNDARDIPTVRMGYGQDVPILYASLGVRRICALAYMLSWAWREHTLAAAQLGREPSPHVVVLFDEVEAHLHPRWQRAIVPALLKVAQTLTSDHSASVQLVATTHSPLVLASVEPRFEPEQDKLFALELLDGVVSLGEQPWAKQGDVINWLVSKSFGLAQARSMEAESAIEAAEAWMRGDHSALPPGLDHQDAIHAELQRVLAGHDPFWPRWIVATDEVGAAQ